jgi:hypothetical protein
LANSNKPPESSDLHFLKGLLSHIEGLSQQEKLKFQKGILNLISNIYNERASDHWVPVFSHDSSGALSLNHNAASHTFSFQLFRTKLFSRWQLLLIQIPTVYCISNTIKLFLYLCHEGVWRSECIDPHFLDLGTSWKWVVSFTPRPLYPRGKSPNIHWIGGWIDPRAGLDNVEKRKFLTLSGLKLRLLSHPARSQSLYRLCYLSSNTIKNIFSTCNTIKLHVENIPFIRYIILCSFSIK